MKEKSSPMHVHTNDMVYWQMEKSVIMIIPSASLNKRVKVVDC